MNESEQQQARDKHADRIQRAEKAGWAFKTVDGITKIKDPEGKNKGFGRVAIDMETGRDVLSDMAGVPE